MSQFWRDGVSILLRGFCKVAFALLGYILNLAKVLDRILHCLCSGAPYLIPQWDERAQPLIAQVKPAPDKHADNDREQNREPWIASAHVGGNCAAQIP